MTGTTEQLLRRAARLSEIESSANAHRANLVSDPMARNALRAAARQQYADAVALDRLADLQCQGLRPVPQHVKSTSH